VFSKVTNVGPLKRDRVSEMNDKECALKKRADPRDRLKEESQDDIVLSPQRRSFGTGCHIAPNKNDNLRLLRNENHLHHQERRDIDHMSHRNENEGGGGNRRIGINRIINPRDKGGIDWGKARDFRDQEEVDLRRNNSRYSRFDYENRRSMANSRNNRYHRDGKHDHNRSLEEDEPEWFVGGPTSQHDTIELKGFEEDSGGHHDTKSCSNDHSSRPNSRGPGSSKNEVYFNDNLCSKTTGNQEKLGSQLNNLEINSHESSINETNLKENQDFDINEMFKLDNWRHMSSLSNENISSIPVNSEYSNGNSSGTSRFAQWFSGNKSDCQSSIDRLLANATFASKNNSRRSSFHEDHLNSIVATADSSSSPSKISYNGPTHLSMLEGKSDQEGEANDEKALFNILKKANINVNELIHKQPPLPVIKFEQAKSVAELEAGLPTNTSSDTKDTENGENMLHKLLAQLEKKSMASQNNLDDLNAKTAFQSQRETQFNNNPNSVELYQEEEEKEGTSKLFEILKPAYYHREPDHLLRGNFNQSKAGSLGSPESFESGGGCEPPSETRSTHLNSLFSNTEPNFSNTVINFFNNNKINHGEVQVTDKKIDDKEKINNSLAQAKMMSANISAFTPTSVIRKIASEKDKETIRKVVSLDQASDVNKLNSIVTSHNTNLENGLDKEAAKVMYLVLIFWL